MDRAIEVHVSGRKLKFYVTDATPRCPHENHTVASQPHGRQTIIVHREAPDGKWKLCEALSDQEHARFLSQRLIRSKPWRKFFGGKE